MTRRKFLKRFLLGGAASLIGGGAWFASSKPANAYYSGPVSANFNGRTFFNPGGRGPGGLGGLLKWLVFEERAKWPKSFPSPFAGARPKDRVDGLEITMIGHATLLVQINGVNFITDPVFSDRASPYSFAGPRRVNAPGVTLSDLPKIDAVLLSHNHYDHLDIATLKELVVRHNPLILTPLGNDAIILKSIPAARIQVGDWGDVFSVRDTKVHFEPIHHWSARGVRDRSMALWAGFVVEALAGKVYVVGDTGFHDGINYRAAAEKHGQFKAAILPIGAYNPRWFMKAQHQTPEEAVEGHVLCNAETSIAHHWGVFQLTNEPMMEPVERLEKAMAAKGLAKDAFVVLRPGERWG